jgi:hypothetical protein
MFSERYEFGCRLLQRQLTDAQSFLSFAFGLLLFSVSSFPASFTYFSRCFPTPLIRLLFLIDHCSNHSHLPLLVSASKCGTSYNSCSSLFVYILKILSSVTGSYVFLKNTLPSVEQNSVRILYILNRILLIYLILPAALGPGVYSDLAEISIRSRKKKYISGDESIAGA